MAESDETTEDPARALLTDGFGRIHDLVGRVTSGAGGDVLAHRVDPGANTVAWLVWHLTRVQDTHVADLAGFEPVWSTEGWCERFNLSLDAGDTGYGATTADVAALDGVTTEQLTGYHEAVNAMTERYLATIDGEELGRIVDRGWDPPVTASARLVSVISDCLQHLGQAAFIRGAAERTAT